MLDIAWITDIHNPPSETTDDLDHPVDQRAYKATILATLEQFVAETRRRMPALVVNGGDCIDATADACQDGVLQQQVCDYFEPLKDRSFTLWGNHDFRNGDKLDLAENFNFIASGKKLDFPEASVLLWHVDAAPKMPEGAGAMEKYYLADKPAMDWLKTALASCPLNKPVLIFTHLPLDADGYTNPADGNERAYPNRFYYRNGQDIRNILRESRRDIWTFSGHRHINRNFKIPINMRLFTMDRMWRPFSKAAERLQGFNHARIAIHNGRLCYTRFGAKPEKIEFRI